MKYINIFCCILQPEYRLLIGFGSAFLLGLYLFPVIVNIARYKNIFDIPDERKKHENPIPVLGGLGIYLIVTIFSLIIINISSTGSCNNNSQLSSMPSIAAALTIMFFTGLKDDLINISPYKKLFAEIVALGCIVIIGDIRISDFQGILGIGKISYTMSIIISIFAGIVIINSINLIDGIDGLASGIAIIAFCSLGIKFWQLADFEYAIFSFIIVGVLLAFFYYNVFSKKNKIFMGDSGALVIGLAITVVVFHFNEENLMLLPKEKMIAAPAFCVATLLLPLYDSLRVVIIRLIKKQDPFKADRNHLHHVLIDMGYSHKKASFLLCIIGIGFVFFTFAFNYWGNNWLILMMIILSILISSCFSYTKIKKQEPIKTNSPHTPYLQ